MDIISDVNLAYSEHARKYLHECGLPKERVYVTGSPMAEVLHQNLAEIEKSDILKKLGLQPHKYILLSAHREENIDTEKNFVSLFNAINKMAEKYDIVEFDKNGKAISIEEKPEHPKSNYCVTGLYFYDNRVVEFAKNLKPSDRGELEITDLNRIYLEDGSLNVELLGQGFTWLDTGTHESLVDATNFVKTVEQHQHRKIACLEEIAYLNGWISKEELMEVYEVMKKNQYGQYLKDVMDGKYQEHLF